MVVSKKKINWVANINGCSGDTHPPKFPFMSRFPTMPSGDEGNAPMGDVTPMVSPDASKAKVGPHQKYGGNQFFMTKQ